MSIHTVYKHVVYLHVIVYLYVTIYYIHLHLYYELLSIYACINSHCMQCHIAKASAAWLLAL